MLLQRRVPVSIEQMARTPDVASPMTAKYEAPLHLEKLLRQKPKVLTDPPGNPRRFKGGTEPQYNKKEKLETTEKGDFKLEKLQKRRI